VKKGRKERLLSEKGTSGGLEVPGNEWKGDETIEGPTKMWKRVRVEGVGASCPRGSHGFEGGGGGDAQRGV